MTNHDWRRFPTGLSAPTLLADAVDRYCFQAKREQKEHGIHGLIDERPGVS